ncbi:hypothetical protein EMIHUDRAFT_246103 [Emiliania huxleyi CCMP1516]|uniref:Uncharacterized protein n=2 Tax=Emiliania huxleyi TaxID=2903 RepID=A0A0D3IV29_EMIH1|nr:hypothetical protein EMIHUDRAFT_246103 [Emiliania huxleyi CCMP1516]EOD15114.1 hypothetical protein EMIHUDRAFT_246103 [Emiliania huxleyi CCMP1516]|eukprot:XP_005767543.1 hypothetical protein EMIHUDRAFT_246103 [Emiliania huxleyi CCMP1516]
MAEAHLPPVTNLPPIRYPPDASTVPWLEQGTEEMAEDRLVDAAGCAVMMRWETPLMEAHADFVCAESRGKVLNVGHGMGIVDAAISRHSPRLHVIWRWQSADVQAELESLGPFDGVFFDTYEETVEDFLALLLRLLRPGGRFSFCNMYQPHDAVRHVAYSAYLQARLAPLGLSCCFERLELRVPPETWRGLRLNYWPHASYLLPRCRRSDPAATPPRPLKRRRSAAADGPLPPTLEPLDGLLWSAKHWACRSATRDSCAGRTGAAPTLALAWERCEALFWGDG